MATTPQVAFVVDDDADPEEKGPPIQVRVQPNNYGVDLVVINPYGSEIARVGLDYHANALKGLVYEDGKDEPQQTIELCCDVESAMKVHPPKVEDEEPPLPKEPPK